MLDFADARRTMVDCQLRPVDVNDPGVLAAMNDLPRERFVPAAKAALAYLDSDVAVLETGGQAVRSLLKPAVVARLAQVAQVRAGDHVLVVGGATGFSAALLARLGGTVVALEQDAKLGAAAADALAGIANVSLVNGALAAGWAAAAPYDVVFVDGAIEVEPTALLAQLREGGRLVAIFGRGGAGKAMVYRLDRGDVSAVPVFNAAAPVLPGFERVAEFQF